MIKKTDCFFFWKNILWSSELKLHLELFDIYFIIFLKLYTERNIMLGKINLSNMICLLASKYIQTKHTKLYIHIKYILFLSVNYVSTNSKFRKHSYVSRKNKIVCKKFWICLSWTNLCLWEQLFCYNKNTLFVINIILFATINNMCMLA